MQTVGSPSGIKFLHTLVSRDEVCDRLSMMQQQAWLRTFCVPILQSAPSLKYWSRFTPTHPHMKIVRDVGTYGLNWSRAPLPCNNEKMADFGTLSHPEYRLPNAKLADLSTLSFEYPSPNEKLADLATLHFSGPDPPPSKNEKFSDLGTLSFSDPEYTPSQIYRGIICGD